MNELRTLIEIVSQYEHLTAQTLITTMLVAVFCGFLLYLLYRFFNRNVLYSENFGVLIILATGATAFIIITIGANFMLSLGLVGALSIVRFRAAVKEPLDVGFLFIGIAAGLAAGARLYLVAIIGTVILGTVYLVMCLFRGERRNFLLILRYLSENEDNMAKKLGEKLFHKVKNKTFSNGEIELTLEIKAKQNNTDFMSEFTTSEDIISAVLVEYSGDYT